MIERPSRYVYLTKLYPCYSLWSLNKLRTYEYSIIAFYSDDCEWIKKRVATIIILELECVIYNDMHIMHDRNTDNLRYQEYLFFVMCMLCYEKKIFIITVHLNLVHGPTCLKAKAHVVKATWSKWFTKAKQNKTCRNPYQLTLHEIRIITVRNIFFSFIMPIWILKQIMAEYFQTRYKHRSSIEPWRFDENYIWQLWHSHPTFMAAGTSITYIERPSFSLCDDKRSHSASKFLHVACYNPEWKVEIVKTITWNQRYY